MPGYPEEIIVECTAPTGYYSPQWTYEQWREGVWTNFGNITRCIDPNRCYDAIPALPNDFTVVNNQTLENPDAVNTTIQYSCSRKCNAILMFFCGKGWEKTHSFEKSVIFFRPLSTDFQ